MKTKSKAKFQNKIKHQNVSKKLNPFEMHINRSKHQVLGRKLKSDHGLPGISKNKAIQKRKKTLLQEYKMKDKLSHFIDQRIGGNNSGMTEDDRIMARFAAERMRRYNKKTMFNLSESSEVTHRGQTLSEIEKFEDVRSDDEDEDDRGKSGVLKGKFVESAHFGGGLFSQSKKDRGSLIDELINESKKRKAERQRNKEETLEATEQLDEEWKTLGMLVTSKADTPSEEVSKAQKKDDYDVIMRRLKFEPQAQATQRFKTDEEIAKEDKEKLEKLEKERLKQLREVEAVKYGNHRSADDLDDGFSYEIEDVNDDDLTSKTEKSKSSDSSSESDVETASEDDEAEEDGGDDENDGDGDEEEGDDDGEDNDDEDISGEKEGTKPQQKKSKIQKEETLINEVEMDSDVAKNKSEEEETDVKADVGNDFSAEVDAESSDDECAMDDLTDLMPPVIEENNSDSQLIAKVLAKAKSDKNNEKTTAQEENKKIDSSIDLDLPYILSVPDTYESFKELLSRHSVDQQNVIFERLVKSNHPSLEPGNKKKMLSLAEYIMDLINEGEVSWKALPTLAMHFGGIKEFNRVECLNMLVKRILARLDDFSRTSLTVPAMKCLVWYILLLLKPQGMDMLLPVSRPVLSLACQLISNADPGASATVPLLCCCLLLQDAKCSFLMYTEAITFLHKCVQFFISKSDCLPICKDTSQRTTPSKSITPSQSSSSHSVVDNMVEDLRLHLLDEEDPTVRVSQVLYCSTMLLTGFVKVYRKYPQSKILFKPVHQSYKQIKVESLPLTVKQEVEELQTLLEVLQSIRLPPVVKTAKKPKALRQYEPSFHNITIVGRSQRGLPAEKQEEQKLLHKYKHEMKGAMRELRRDRSFLASVKLREKVQSDEQRMKKVREILGSAAAQQGELRSLKRKK